MKGIIERWRATMAAGRGRPDWTDPEPPASDIEINAAEEALGRKLPSDLVEMHRCAARWLWRDPEYDAVLFFSPDEIVDSTLEPEQEIEQIIVSVTNSKRVKPYFYSSQRVTFACSDYQRFQIDEDPAPGGISGQIVLVDHDEETIDIAADSLQAFLEHGLACLEAQLSGGFPRGNE